MKEQLISRKNFLQVCTWSTIGIPFLQLLDQYHPAEINVQSASHILGRITQSSIPFFKEPDSRSIIIGKYLRDDIITIQEEIHSPYEPKYNPHWYRTANGYVHSAYIQRIEKCHLNPIIKDIPKQGVLGKITVPYSQSWFINRNGYWKKVYRLYYDSIHWITGILEDDQGELRIQIKDEWLRTIYYISPKHIQFLDYHDFEPISPEVPARDKKILVSLESQTVTAFEENEAIYSSRISSGLQYMETPHGYFKINRKYPSKHMGNGSFTKDIFAYELPGVPWVSFFTENGIAFHGAYWHNNFGTPMSRGCINMSCEDANWLFRWSAPQYTEYHEGIMSRSVVSDDGISVVVV